MISSSNPVAPAFPAETSILGIPSPSDSTSSFADQLASAVTQAGNNPPSDSAVPTTITGTPRQNSDIQQLSLGNTGASVVAGSPASASGSSPVQYSFLQYRMDAPSTRGIPSGIDTPSAATSSGGGIQQSSAPNSSVADPVWLSPPYYTPPPPVFVSWENPPGVINKTASPETDLQNLAAQYINDPLQFDWGGVQATTPQQFIDNVVSYAQSRAAAYPKASPEGYDPVAMGTKYANLVLDSIKQIQYDTVGSSPYASVYDAWVAGMNTFPGTSGTASAT
jgi:hypothetical protein